LGNPGAEYAGTRHNAGFDAVDLFLAKYERSFRVRNARSGEAREGNFAGEKLIVLKPLTFMNLSGNAVSPVVRGESLKPSEVLVIYDDIDLPVGKMRLRKNGGSGGHNGMKSIIEALGTEQFPRLRIGIGTEGSKRDPDYVLGRFTGAEREIYEALIRKAVEAVELMQRRGIEEAMTRFNSVNTAAGPEE
jgi:PTH1 family peptidyl-tRNA hydrolase